MASFHFKDTHNSHFKKETFRPTQVLHAGRSSSTHSPARQLLPDTPPLRCPPSFLSYTIPPTLVRPVEATGGCRTRPRWLAAPSRNSGRRCAPRRGCSSASPALHGAPSFATGGGKRDRSCSTMEETQAPAGREERAVTAVMTTAVYRRECQSKTGRCPRVRSAGVIHSGA